MQLIDGTVDEIIEYQRHMATGTAGAPVKSGGDIEEEVPGEERRCGRGGKRG